jgi:hypothetical protein
MFTGKKTAKYDEEQTASTINKDNAMEERIKLTHLERNIERFRLRIERFHRHFHVEWFLKKLLNAKAVRNCLKCAL